MRRCAALRSACALSSVVLFVACSTAPAPEPLAPPPAAAPASSLSESRALLLLMADRKLYDPTALELMLAGEPAARACAGGGARADRRRARAEPAAGVARRHRPRGAARRCLRPGRAGRRRGEARPDGRGGGRRRRDRAARGRELWASSACRWSRFGRRSRRSPAEVGWQRLAPALFRFDEPAAVEAAREGLESRGRATRGSAPTCAYALGRLARPEGAEALRGLIGDSDPAVRAWAARGLGEVGGIEDLARLAPLTADAAPSPAIQALRAGARLVARSSRRAAALLGAAGPRRDRARPRPACAPPRSRPRAASCRTPSSKARCVPCSAGGEPRERELALAALAAGRVEGASELVRAAGGSPERWLRARAAEAAGPLGELELLAGLAADREPPVRVAALESMAAGTAGLADADGATAELAERFLDDPDPTVRATALDLATRAPRLPAARLAAAIDAARADALDDARLAGVRALAARGQAVAAERAAVVEALGRLGEDRDWLVRREAAAALAGLGEPRPAIGPLELGRDLEFYRGVLAQTAAPRRVEIATDRGALLLELACPEAPLTCLSFLQLGRQGYFDGTALPPRGAGLRRPGRRPAGRRLGRSRLQPARRDQPPALRGGRGRHGALGPGHRRQPVLRHPLAPAPPRRRLHRLRPRWWRVARCSSRSARATGSCRCGRRGRRRPPERTDRGSGPAPSAPARPARTGSPPPRGPPSRPGPLPPWPGRNLPASGDVSRMPHEPAVMTDEELVRSVLAGDRERFGELVERYQGRLVNYLYRLVRNLDDAHDLAQEVFVRVYQALDRFDPQYRFSTWLFRVAQNAAIDVIRKRRFRLVPLVQPDADGRRGSATSSWRATSRPRTTRSKAASAISGCARRSTTLPWEYRELILLRHYGELAYEEIAQIEGDAARHGQEQALPRPPDAQGACWPATSSRTRPSGDAPIWPIWRTRRWSTTPTASGSTWTWTAPRAGPTRSAPTSATSSTRTSPRAPTAAPSARGSSSSASGSRRRGSPCVRAFAADVLAALEPAPWEARAASFGAGLARTVRAARRPRRHLGRAVRFGGGRTRAGRRRRWRRSRAGRPGGALPRRAPRRQRLRRRLLDGCGCRDGRMARRLAAALARGRRGRRGAEPPRDPPGARGGAPPALRPARRAAAERSGDDPARAPAARLRRARRADLGGSRRAGSSPSREPEASPAGRSSRWAATCASRARRAPESPRSTARRASSARWRET